MTDTLIPRHEPNSHTGPEPVHSLDCLVRSSHLDVRLARTPLDVIAAQRLRYEVFYEEMGAIPSPRSARSRLDFEKLDDVCDHLLVIDRRGFKDRIVGTYRLLSQDAATRAGGFYSAGEFKIDHLLTRHPDKRFLEVGRSCVHADYRKKRTIELLWQGLWTYIRHHEFDAMFGCASLPGVDPGLFADSVRLIRQEASAPEAWRVPVVDGPAAYGHTFAGPVMHSRSALKALPPLVKAYMRLGAYFSDDMFIDHTFGTTDFLVTLPVTRIRERYFGRFGAPDARPTHINH